MHCIGADGVPAGTRLACVVVNINNEKDINQTTSICIGFQK